MKKAVLFFGSISIIFASCTKQPVLNPATGTSSQHDVNIEYRITDQSGSVSIEYIAPVTGTTSLALKSEIVNKTYATISFTAKNFNTYSISAKNVDVNAQDITDDIYVDGVLFKSGSLDHTTLTASASGRVE